ncbi:hypothetical protein AQJ66_36385 [Streptomyces bungoensis]|uniref:DUF397 domain-containing protein n=1 Tax=Streptomyces bungoensis TaxID=285568 RepID=A0A101SJI6_9ACTN|nr:DUF397 domain-containing protein [Streptomyces bungoensis]KUN75175.1 hypothetical protein AQJ66_36385 [Streptomyces bungoensis]
MTLAIRWRKSSYSGGGDGNTCVEIAELDTHISIRDSKAPARATLTFVPEAFTPFLEALKVIPTANDGSTKSS